MSTHFVKFYAESLHRNGEFYVHLAPKEAPFYMQDNPCYKRKAKTLILLHGYSGDCTDWLYCAPSHDYCTKYNLNIVMPTGGLGFYLDKAATGHRYCTFIGKDLIEYLRDTFNIALTKEDTFIGGLSMGGFGALHTGLAFPDTFGGIIALSSALITYEIHNFKPDSDPVMANYEYYTDTFGPLDKVRGSVNDPEYLFTKNVENGVKNPPIYLACGSEDFLIAPNRRMRDFLTEQKADFTYVEEPGVHDWAFWVPHAYSGLEYMLGRYE